MKVLQVIDQAFRATGEEQDDTLLWLSRSMRGAGADFRILLAGNAVSYALVRDRAPELELGDWRQTHPADVGSDVAELLASGVEVAVVTEDLLERGLDARQCRRGIQGLARDELPQLYNSVDQVWQW